MRHTLINPVELGAPRGYSHGILAAPGRWLFIAGQIGWDRAQKLVSPRFYAQFGQALQNVCTVLEAAGGRPEHLCRLTIYVTDRRIYLSELSEVGQAYRTVLGHHFPAMALLEVSALLEEGALVEIEGTAVVPDSSEPPDQTGAEV